MLSAHLKAVIGVWQTANPTSQLKEVQYSACSLVLSNPNRKPYYAGSPTSGLGVMVIRNTMAKLQFEATGTADEKKRVEAHSNQAKEQTTPTGYQFYAPTPTRN